MGERILIYPSYSEKFINDNLYGGIGFSKYEFEIINTETFQRLRRIKQQGLTSYTFPCAEHTRFSHSLGVLYIMGRMVEHFYRLGKLNEHECQLLRIAALLHDIGHYPLSHLTEHVYRMRRRKPVDQDISEDVSPLTRFSEKIGDRFAHHEELGVEVIKKRSDICKILKLMHIDPDEVGEIINGKTTNNLYHQLMHSSLDADRLDYLIRDSSSAGVRYGLVDLDYLIRLLLVGEDVTEFGGKTQTAHCLGVNIKGIHALEHYLMARYFSYSQVTMHRTSAVFETLAKAIIWYLAEKGEIYDNYDDIVKVVPSEEFLDFDDSFIWNAIKKSKTLQADPTYNLYRTTLLYRNRIKVPLEIKLVEDKGVKIPDYNVKYYKVRNYVKNSLTNIADCAGLPPSCFGYLEQTLDVDKCQKDLNDQTYYEAPRVIENGKCRLLVQSESSLIKELFEKQLNIFRLFYIDPYPKDDEKSDKLAKKIRDHVLNNAH